MTHEAVAAALIDRGVRRVHVSEPLERHTSWKIGGPADVLCVVEDDNQLRDAIAVARENEIPWLVLGGGNNVLVSDEGIEGLVILNRLRGLDIEGSNGDRRLACGAGVFFARAAQYTARRGFAGMEWGISIPGTVGGGVVNNAGAHWTEVSEALLSAEIINETGETCEVTPDALLYRYRHSVLKSPHAARSTVIVTRCRFRLQPDDPDAVLRRIEALREHRKQTQPIKEASAGSTFTNPPGEHAGALIDRLGLKGRRSGGAQIAPLHANFILNTGGASAMDVVALVMLARERVYAEFGIDLHPEVQLVGRWPEDMIARVTGPRT